MKNWKKQSLSTFLGLQLALLAAVAFSAQAAAIETNAAPAGFAVQKSVFDDDLKNGRDPMFPRSLRRGKAVAAQAPVIAPLIQLTLKGISGSGNRRLALINNQPVAAGETAVVKIATGQVTVHCWQVLEKPEVSPR